ncbi:Dabb family protein [Glaciibacter sp. 2TAF33]|uniref:Dabb family protein n=1 Tax=Glaciibacter sp. 2TAF33 TaxID=3233015 RepID=UPI003F9006CC
MIRHVVSWQLAATDPDERAAHATRIAAGLSGLVGVVDDIRSLEVGADVVGGGNWDVALVADFDDVDALERYAAHPEHQKLVGFIRSVTAQRMAVDFEL